MDDNTQPLAFWVAKGIVANNLERIRLKQASVVCGGRPSP